MRPLHCDCETTFSEIESQIFSALRKIVRDSSLISNGITFILVQKKTITHNVQRLQCLCIVYVGPNSVVLSSHFKCVDMCFISISFRFVCCFWFSFRWNSLNSFRIILSSRKKREKNTPPPQSKVLRKLISNLTNWNYISHMRRLHIHDVCYNVTRSTHN